jgi:iron complex transport system ATP-binding protein
LAQTPSELLLDEPTNHLDIQHQLEILALVARLPVTSIVALHDLNLAAMFCDTLAILQHGKVVAAGAPEDVLTGELMSRVFGVRAHIERSAYHGRYHVQYRLD